MQFFRAPLISQNNTFWNRANGLEIEITTLKLKIYYLNEYLKLFLIFSEFIKNPATIFKCFKQFRPWKRLNIFLIKSRSDLFIEYLPSTVKKLKIISKNDALKINILVKKIQPKQFFCFWMKKTLKRNRSYIFLSFIYYCTHRGQEAAVTTLQWEHYHL